MYPTFSQSAEIK